MPRTLDEIRAEHYPFMVGTIVGWLHAFHHQPETIEQALRDACREYLEWAKARKDADAE